MFADYFGVDLVSDRDFFTFPLLKGAPTLSIQGAQYLGATAIKTYSGHPWEVMKQNNLVYNLSTKTMVQKSTISTLIQPERVDYYFMAQTKLVQAGSKHKASGQQILSFDSEFVQDYFQLRLSEFKYE